jgi:hypothetical protein
MNALTLLTTPFAIIGAIYVYNAWIFDRRLNNLPEAKPFEEKPTKVGRRKSKQFNRVMLGFYKENRK